MGVCIVSGRDVYSRLRQDELVRYAAVTDSINSFICMSASSSSPVLLTICLLDVRFLINNHVIWNRNLSPNEAEV